MSNHLASPAPIVRPADDLRTLARQANSEHEAVEKAARESLEHACVAGKALLQAHEQCRQARNFVQWMKDNLSFSKSTAYRYMSVAKHWDKFPTAGNLSLKAALELLARDGEEDGPQPRGYGNEWTACLIHRYSNQRHPECEHCRSLNGKTPSTERQPPWTEALAKAQKHTASLEQISTDVCRMLTLPSTRKRELQQAVESVKRIYSEAERCDPVPIKPPFRKNCDKCHRSILIAMKEDRGYIALEDANKGKWSIIENMACHVGEGGTLRFHGMSCKQIQAVSNEPIPE